jgi:hypothetical protein
MENRRRYPRYETEFEARIYTADLNLSVTVVDISDGGVGAISEQPIEIGTKAFVSLFPIIKDPVKGTVVWSLNIEKDQKYYFRIGVETENLALNRMKALGFPKRSERVSETISQGKKTDSENGSRRKTRSGRERRINGDPRHHDVAINIPDRRSTTSRRRGKDRRKST